MLKKTELYIEEKQLDLFGDEAFLLNFNVADISDISAKAASYSKEIDIPATKENNKIFSHLFNVSSEGYFNPLSKKTSALYIDGVCVMRGYFKLNSITIIDNEYVTYHGVIFEDSVNFVDTLGDLELSNLVLPLTGTTFSPTGITATITINNIVGNDFRTIPPGVNPPQRSYNVNYNNLIISNPGFGLLQAIDKNIPNPPWLGTASQYNRTTINAFVALQPINVKLTPNIIVFPARLLRWQWYKVVPSGSTYIHVPIAGAGGGGSSIFPVVSITTPTPAAGIDLQPGEGIYLGIFDSNPISFTSTPPPPIGISGASQITGTVTPRITTTTNKLLIDENFILSNIATTTGSTSNDICFPLVDYNQTFPYSATNKKNSKLSESEKPAVRVKFEDLRPGVFVKKVWDAIFKQAGFKYKSKFLDTNMDLFNKLIVIGGMEEDEVQSIQYENVLTGTTNYTLVEPLQDLETDPGLSSYTYDYRAFLLGGKIPNASPTNYWNKKTIRPSYTENLKVKYTDKDRKNAQYGFSGAEYGDVLRASVAGKYKVQAQIKGTSLPVQRGGVDVSTNTQGLIYRLKIEKIKEGSYINDPKLFTAPQKSKWEEIKVVTFKRELAITNQEIDGLLLDETIELEQGDLVRVVLYASAEAQFDPNNTDVTPYTSRTILNVNGDCYVKYYRLGTWVGYEATSITNMLPRSMKQKDFVLGIAKMFNLYFEPSKDDPRTIFIEPRDVYYEDGRVLNWEKKLDYTNPLDISILPHDQAKNFVFKYSDDSSDYYTEQFKKFTATALTFGSYEFKSPDEYTTETSELELPFAASYLQKISGTDPVPGYSGSDANPMVITKIIDPDSQKPGYDGKPSSWKKEPRILYYGGKINLPPSDKRNYDFFLTSNYLNGDVYEVAMQYYPYAGHYDKPVEPTLDINFYTDTHYLPTTYWKNNFGTANLTPISKSATSINLSTLIIGNAYGVTLSTTPIPYLKINSAVDKYVKVTNPATGQYFKGTVSSTPGNIVVVRVTEVFGTGTFSDWTVTLTDVFMKNNLFNVFYKQQMIELTDQSSRLMTCNMYLTPTDIANFRFNDIIYAHKEYWRVNKIIDFDTSSDVNQTTKVELIKILRAQTSTLIDYVQGGYLGINGGTGAGTTTTGNGTINGTTPVIYTTRPVGTLATYRPLSLDIMMSVRNSIIQDENGLAPTYFDKEVTIYTGPEELTDTVMNINNDVNVIREYILNKPIGDTVIFTEADAGVQAIGDTIRQVYFNVANRSSLFEINLPNVTTDGYTINFDAYNGTTTTFMKFTDTNVNTPCMFVINGSNGLIARYDLAKNIWVISKG